MNVAKLLTQPEGKTLEFKRDLSSPDGVIRSAVAFANTSGGTIVIGVEDGTRHIRGVEDPVQVAEKAANLLAHRIHPRLVPDIEVLQWQNQQLVAITVYPVRTGPHYVADAGPNSGTYVRIGASNRIADEALLNELRRIARNESFDEQPLHDAPLSEIDIATVRTRFSGIRSITKATLETLRIHTRYNGKLIPTVGGILCFGNDRFRYFPDTYIKMALFAGVDRRKILDNEELRGTLFDNIESAIEFVRKQARHELIIDAEKSARRSERWSIPLTAIREAITNAVVHADYSQVGAPVRVAIFANRIEIDNPGILPMGLTITDLGTGVSKLRNRMIGRMFQELGLVEQWGSGIARMRRECEIAGVGSPVFEEIATQFRVTIPIVTILDTNGNKQEETLITWLRKVGGASTSAVAKQFGWSPRTARTRLAALVSRGSIAELKRSETDPQRKYVVIERQ